MVFSKASEVFANALKLRIPRKRVCQTLNSNAEVVNHLKLGDETHEIQLEQTGTQERHLQRRERAEGALCHCSTAHKVSFNAPLNAPNAVDLHVDL